MCPITKGIQQGEKEERLHRRRGVRRRRIEPTGDRHLGKQQCKRFESNEAKTDFEGTKRKKGAETLVTTRKTSRNAAETLPGQGTLPTSTLRTLPFNSCTQNGLATGPQSRDGRCCGVFEVCAAVGGRETRHGGDPRREAVAVSAMP